MSYYMKENEIRFQSSEVVATQGAIALMELQNKPELGADLIARHFCGDWGDVCKEEHKANERHLKHKIHHSMSVFNIGGQDIWLITEWDRNVTTIVLPDEFDAA